MPLTIRDAFEQHYVPNHPHLAPLTRRRYHWEIQRWERHSTNPAIDAIRTEHFHGYRAACLQHGLKPVTIEASVRTVLQVLRLCGPASDRRQGLDLIPRVPYVGRSLRAVSPQRFVPTVAQLRRLCRVADEAQWPPRCDCGAWWRGWIGFAFVTGLRLSDLFRLRADAIQGDVVTWTAHKTGIEHVFVLPGWLLPWLSGIPARGELLFPCRELPHFIRRELRRLCAAAEVPVITPHALRRAAITEWSVLDTDCGKLIHGEGLGIRSRYVDAERKLRGFIDRFPDLSHD